MNINLLGVLKRMAKNPNIRKDIWMESETQMVSILNRSSRKQKVDDHFKNATTDNDFHTGIHSWVSYHLKLNMTPSCPHTHAPFYRFFSLAIANLVYDESP